MLSEYTRYNFIIYGPYKSKQYLDWFHKRYCNNGSKVIDAHHILNKKIDYLVMNVEHFYHIGPVHKNKVKYFEKWLKRSVDIFLQYVKRYFGEMEIADYEPEILKELFDKVYKLENQQSKGE